MLSFILGQIYYARGNPGKAITFYRQAKKNEYTISFDLLANSFVAPR